MTDNKELFAAMAKAFAAIEGATKDTLNPHFRVKYADLAAVVAAIKPALCANDLWFTQINHEQAGGVCIETIVCHSRGQQMSFGKLFVPVSKNDAQSYGSALTYARRYSLLTAFGVCPEDDDGNAAVKQAVKKPDQPKHITDEQRDELALLVDSLQHNIADICQGMGVKSLSNIRAANFEKAQKFITDFGKQESEKI